MPWQVQFTGSSIYERFADSAAMMVHLGNFGAVHMAEVGGFAR